MKHRKQHSIFLGIFASRRRIFFVSLQYVTSEFLVGLTILQTCPLGICHHFQSVTSEFLALYHFLHLTSFFSHFPPRDNCSSLWFSSPPHKIYIATHHNQKLHLHFVLSWWFFNLRCCSLFELCILHLGIVVWLLWNKKSMNLSQLKYLYWFYRGWVVKIQTIRIRVYVHQDCGRRWSTSWLSIIPCLVTWETMSTLLVTIVLTGPWSRFYSACSPSITKL